MKTWSMAIILAAVIAVAILAATVFVIKGPEKPAAMNPAFSGGPENCMSIKGDYLTRQFCLDIKMLKAARRNKNSDDCVQTNLSMIRWSVFMCGFMSTPTEEYCERWAYRAGIDSAQCPAFIRTVTGSSSENLGTSNDIALFSKAFYLSDSRYCSGIKAGAFYEIPNSASFNFTANMTAPPITQAGPPIRINISPLCPYVS